MTVSGLIANLLVPPMGLLTVGMVCMLIFRGRGRVTARIALAMAAGLLALALPATAGTLLASLERDLPLSPSSADPPGAIVVLGGDVRRAAAADGKESMTIGPISLDRCRIGADLSRRFGLPILVTGGDPWRRGTPVAALMARTLSDDFDTPARWVEARSLDTWENARESAALLRLAGIRSIYLVTDGWHMRRALLAFAHYGIVATAAPTLLDPWPSLRPSEFIPQASAWLGSYYALHEWAGLVFYRLRNLLDHAHPV